MIKPPTRACQWIPSTDPGNSDALDGLAKGMMQFYTENPGYYASIDYATSAWIDDPIYQDLAARLARATRILELGCGSARVLDHYPDLAARYTGVDFSKQLLEANRNRHPAACFAPLNSDGRPPVDLGEFDVVFSVFVLEHCVRPRQFLDDSLQMTRAGGLWILRCPHFLGVGRMPSQRVGFSPGTGRAKLARGKLLDAIATAWDSRVRIPIVSRTLRHRSATNPQTTSFFVNLAPTCVADPFAPDRDAVYYTYEQEIIRHIQAMLRLVDVSHTKTRKEDIYIVGQRLPK